MSRFASVSSDYVKHLDLSDLMDSPRVSKTLDGSTFIREDTVLEIYSRMLTNLDLVRHLLPDTPGNKEYMQRKESYRRVACQINADLGIEIPRFLTPAESDSKRRLDEKVAEHAANMRGYARPR